MGKEKAKTTINNNEKYHYGFHWFIVICSITLLLLIPEQSKWVDTNRGWYTQPMVGPLFSLSLLLLFTGMRLVAAFRSNDIIITNPVDLIVGSIESYRVALISGFIFLLYINALSFLGFYLSTLLFTCTLLWLSRLLDKFWFICSLITTSAIILIFRVGVSIWLPDVWLYSLLPEEWANFFNLYL